LKAFSSEIPSQNLWVVTPTSQDWHLRVWSRMSEWSVGSKLSANGSPLHTRGMGFEV